MFKLKYPLELEREMELINFKYSIDMKIETSILIPTYNNGQFLLSCIKSILSQEYRDYEIIIIDDYSTDETEYILKILALTDTRIKYFKNKKSKGLVSALNYGVSLCQGIYIARMDSDDLMFGNRLNEQIIYLKENPNIHAVCSGMQLIDKDGKHLRQSLGTADIEICKLMHLFLNMYTHATMTAYREVFTNFKYKKNFLYCEDFELWSRIIQKYNIKHLQSIHHIYRIYDKKSPKFNTRKSSIQAVMTIFSNQLNYYNITHNERELLIHYGLFYEKNQIGNSEEIQNWLNKIFRAKQIIKIFSPNTIHEVKNQLFNKFNLS